MLRTLLTLPRRVRLWAEREDTATMIHHMRWAGVPEACIALHVERLESIRRELAAL